MVEDGSMLSGGRERTRSLQREWTRAFVLMLAVVLATGVGTIVGVWHLVGQFNAVAHQRDLETSVVAALRISLVDHEQIGHQLLSGQPIDRSAFLRQQFDIVNHFEHAIQVFPAGNGTRDILRETLRSWQLGLTDAGLWGNQALNMTGVHLEENPVFGAASDTARGMLDELDAPSLRAMHAGLASGQRLERYMIVLLVGLFSLALGVTWHFRRRMAKDLFRPVANLREGVLRLRSGELDHEIPIARNDELGELATAFNDMAAVLRNNHQALTHRATRDVLTGLANRAVLTERLIAAFEAPDDARSSCASLLFVDVDDFKDVNDSLGHEAGDSFLIQLVDRLRGCVGPHDLVARLGGDEFAIVVAESDGEPRRTGSDVADAVLAALQHPVTINATKVAVSVSIGVAQRRPETVDAAELLRHADFAMYMAKGSGKGRFQVFDAQMHDAMAGQAVLKNELTTAIDQGQLRLDYQPITDLDTGRVVGVEALVRWEHPTLGLLAPDVFIPLAEQTGDIEAIGCWVLQTAARQVATWQRTIPDCQDLWVSVNLSAFQLPHPESLTALEQILADPAGNAATVVLEVTETALAADLQGAVVSLTSLRNTGARIAIDDFGTGFSSLSTLANLPVDILKIHRSFVSGQGPSGPSVPLLEGILSLAHKLSLDVIAEGIEEPDQLELLRSLGCQTGQGFLLGRPVPAQDIAIRLASHTTPQPATTGP